MPVRRPAWCARCACLESGARTRRDAHVAAMVACYRAGVCTRAEILAETGMSSDAYHDARRRLLRLVKHLGDELRAKVDEGL